MLEAAVIAGLTSEGVDALRVGVLPTPAVAHLTGAYDAEFGVMISASHNPMPDNGIKIFGPGGHKLDDATEDRIEELVSAGPGSRPDRRGHRPRASTPRTPSTATCGTSATAVTTPARRADRRRRLRARRRVGRRTAGLPRRGRQRHRDQRRAQRAQHQRRLRVDAPGVLQEAVLAHGADLGLAHDGDADRCLAVDAGGQVVDGDAIMVILALAMQEAGELASNTLVATVMSNLGLHIAMRAAGIEVRTTGVGDRYVLEELRAGRVLARRRAVRPHRACPRSAPPATGSLTGLRLMSRMAQTRSTLAALAAPMHTLPQVLINVEVADKATVAEAPSVRTAVAEAEAELGDTGRILLRPSGTEQVVRVMVEAADEDTARLLAVAGRGVGQRTALNSDVRGRRASARLVAGLRSSRHHGDEEAQASLRERYRPRGDRNVRAAGHHTRSRPFRPVGS